MKKSKNLPKIENWSLRWKIKDGGKTIVRRVIGEVIDHPEFFNLTEINEEITTFQGREVSIDISKSKISLGAVDKKFHKLIKENGWKLNYSDPITFLENQMFRV